MEQSDKYLLLTAKLGACIQQEMKRQHIDQAGLAAQSKLSQATISNIVNGKDNISMKKYFIVMDALHMDTMAVISACTNAIHINSHNIRNNPFLLSSGNFICDPDNYAFNGQMGQFHTLFYSTNPNDEKALHGTLRLYSGQHDCLAELELITDADENGNPAAQTRKIYNGFVTISLIQGAVYILLMNERIGELCFLTYPYKQILRSGISLECTMAMAVTISSGIDSRIPTAHRLFLSRKKWDKADEKLLLAQLLLNKSSIRISAPAFDELRQSGKLSDEFLQCFDRHCTLESYYETDEDYFKQLIVGDKTHFRELCLLRSFSTAPKNNKISPKLINHIFQNIIRPIQDNRYSALEK